jgi:hypothetical protein
MLLIARHHALLVVHVLAVLLLLLPALWVKL